MAGVLSVLLGIFVLAVVLGLSYLFHTSIVAATIALVLVCLFMVVYIAAVSHGLIKDMLEKKK